MAKYRIGKNNYEVDLTKIDFSLASDCETEYSLNYDKRLEDIFVADKDLKDENVGIGFYVGFTVLKDRRLKFRYLEYTKTLGIFSNNPHDVNRRVVCTDAEKAMFEKLLNAA